MGDSGVDALGSVDCESGVGGRPAAGTDEATLGWGRASCSWELTIGGRQASSSTIGVRGEFSSASPDDSDSSSPGTDRRPAFSFRSPCFLVSRLFRRSFRVAFSSSEGEATDMPVDMYDEGPFIGNPASREKPKYAPVDL